MIFETLAAMSDYNDNLKFDNSPNVAYDKATMQALSTAGKLPLKSETLRVGNKILTNSEADKYKYFVDGIINRTPMAIVQENMAPYA